MAAETYRYRAFISYRHVERDRRWARWLIEKLETFRTPKALVRAGAPLRVGHLFRDDDEIPASSDLSHQIEDALKASQFLIVVCSRDTPKSQWVRREIQYFRKLGRSDRILVLLVDGEPNEAFPPELLHAAGSEGEPDMEPIAADVRPRSDEPRHATEHRAFLRIAAGLLGVGFDDLAQRDHQRRVRKERILGAIAAALLLAVGAAAYAYWDYSRVKFENFAAVGSRWGQPVGIQPISAKEASHRAVSYTLSFTRGLLTGLKRHNGSGALVGFASDDIESELQDADVAEIRIPFPGTRAVELDYYNAGGRLLRTEKFTWLPNGNASVALTDAAGGAQALSVSRSGIGFAADDGRRSQISQYGLAFDAAGLLKQRLYLSVWGTPVRDSAGSFGRAYTYTPAGQIAAIYELDAKASILASRTGIASLARSYDRSGLVTSAIWRNITGHPTMNPHGYAELQFERDTHGNPVQTKYQGKDGKPVLRSDTGYAALICRYDDAGNCREYTYVSTRGRPIAAKGSNIARSVQNFDTQGHVVDERYFDTAGQPALAGNVGAARVASRYDRSGNLTGSDYFGLDGKPVLNKPVGAARIRQRYDDRGNLTEEAYFGLDGKPTYRKGPGIARFVAAFNERNLVTAKAYFGIDGKPIAANDNSIWQSRESYDDRGNLIGEQYFGPDGRPALNKLWGSAAIKFTYDDRGNRTEMDLSGVDGKPIIGNKGYARLLLQYDERGNEISEDMLGTDGKPILNASGIARFTATYDDAGNNTRISFFDTEGRPMLARQGGIASIEQAYDAQGHVLSTNYFGLDGLPTLWQPGRIASQRRIYDDQGNVVETAFFGKDGRPTLFNGQNCARETEQYDDRGNDVDERCYGVDGKPRLRQETGAARSVERYNARNEAIEQRHFGLDGRPVNGALGYARIVIVRDARGNAVKQDFFGADGRPVTATEMGVARVVGRYDARDLEIEERYFGVDGKPILTKNKGIARQVQLYDTRGDMVYQLYFGLDDKPVWSKMAKGYGLHVRHDARGKAVEGTEMTDPQEVAALAATVP